MTGREHEAVHILHPVDKHQILSSASADGPRSLRVIDNLPDEVILNIFYKGCEDVPASAKPSSRHRKEFVCIIRQINKRWLDIVESVPNSWSLSFWVANLTLSFTHGLRSPDPPLVKQVASFRRQLVTSQGCDLTVSIKVDVYKEKSSDMESDGDPYSEDNPLALPPAQLTKLRLLAHAIRNLTQYQNQVTTMEFVGSRPYLCVQPLNTIAGRWETATRLVQISFRIESVDDPDESIELDHCPRLLDTILQHNSLSTSFVLSFHQLHCLGALDIPSCSWLSEKTKLPTSLRHLIIRTGEPDSLHKLYSYISGQPTLCKSLMTIQLAVVPSTLKDPAELVEPVIWETSSQMVELPSLVSIALMEVPAAELFQFFNCLSFPSLDVLLVDSEQEDDRDLERIPSFGPPPIEPRAQGNSRRLQRLSFTHPGLSLSFLDSFHGRPIELVYFGFYQTPPTALWDDLGSPEVAHTLSGFIPRHLELEGIVYYCARLLIGSMSVQEIESLTVSHLLDPMDQVTASANAAGQEVLSLPVLRKLNWVGTIDDTIRFIGHLDANNLTHVEISLEVSLEEDDEEQVQPEVHHPCPLLFSVRVVTFNLDGSVSEGPNISLFWEAFANAEELRITTSNYSPYHRQSESADSESEPGKEIYPISTLLWRNLGPNPEGSVPFCGLRSLLVSCKLSQAVIGGSSPGESDSTAIDERKIYQDIQRLLDQRYESGALPLSVAESTKMGEGVVWFKIAAFHHRRSG